MGDTNYEDKVNYHAIDPVEWLRKKNINIIETEYFGGFMTTIFCRSEGIHYNKASKRNSLDLFGNIQER